MPPLGSLVADSPMQSIAVMCAGGAFEGEPPFAADSFDEARPDRVTPLG